MLPIIQQRALEPIIAAMVAVGQTIYTDDYDASAR